MTKEELQKEITKTIVDNNYNGMFIAAMRSGKSKMIIDALKLFKGSVLWVVAKSKARDEDLPLEFKKWKLPKKIVKNIEIICYQSLKKIDRVYDLIILDEVQKLTQSNYNSIKDKYNNLLACTGTKPNKRSKNELYDKLSLKNIYTLSVDDAVDNDIISKYSIDIWRHKLNSIDNNIEVKYKRGTKEYSFFTTEAKRYSFLSSRIAEQSDLGRDTKFLKLWRMRFIGSLKTKEDIVTDYLVNNQDKRILIFCTSIDQADKIALSYHSKSDDSCYKAFQNKQINHLAVVNLADDSVTFHDLDEILLISSNSSNVQSVQRIGRSLLYKKDYVAKIIILCAVDTIETTWINLALSDLNPENINYTDL